MAKPATADILGGRMGAGRPSDVPVRLNISGFSGGQAELALGYAGWPPHFMPLGS
ncbi:MAG TPA: hypothetical protein V6C72_07345 [Chroococcales cyanobacterium]